MTPFIMLDGGAQRDGVCSCGHVVDDHELIEGSETLGIPDVWVCTGSRPVDVNADPHPWDAVCGCVLHRAPDPNPGPGLRVVA